ncbi:hypothetical protein L3X38_019015 [Prunus dulcis]|uniref:Uncharacterized protein n=1 Tax=Prunus dulcis TaxID=3755 RepID=A0AAD4ZC56_PRUDU|nr:hypothetical protein L3X38_019015 [Prunus dulcis]
MASSTMALFSPFLAGQAVKLGSSVSIIVGDVRAELQCAKPHPSPKMFHPAVRGTAPTVSNTWARSLARPLLTLLKNSPVITVGTLLGSQRTQKPLPKTVSLRSSTQDGPCSGLWAVFSPNSCLVTESSSEKLFGSRLGPKSSVTVG